MTIAPPADQVLSPTQIDAALAVVTSAWPDERAGAVALVAAVLGLSDSEVGDWPDDALSDALQVVADRLNLWADQSHAAGLARLPTKAPRRPGKPRAVKRAATHSSPAAAEAVGKARRRN